MKIDLHKLERLRTAVSTMKNTNFMGTAEKIYPALYRHAVDVFGQSPYMWLYRRGTTNITLKDYRDYCVRWLDHIKENGFQ